MPPQRVESNTIGAVAQAEDYLVIEAVGIVAAAVASAAALRRIRGTSLPYNVPVVLALLKLPTGALTAVLGLLLMRGGFVPGLSALDSTGQIIAWAIVFGYSQQLFTKYVDSQGQALLDAVRGPGGPAPSPPQPETAVVK
jgi:tetrahydromethanopterin S-methyltransferase subunit C